MSMQVIYQQKDTDKKGLVNIRDYSEEELRDLLTNSIAYLSRVQEEIKKWKMNMRISKEFGLARPAGVNSFQRRFVVECICWGKS